MATDSFQFECPARFSRTTAHLPIRVYHRHLPHWRQVGATYFVTFRLRDSIPQEHLRSLKRWREVWERTHPKPRSDRDWEHLARGITRKTEAWMDEGYGECVFRDQQLAAEMSKSLLHFQNTRYLTSCFAILPNHIHLVMKPLEGFELEQILDGIKGFVSRKVNALLTRDGPLWEEESYDRIIRDEEHLFRVIQYIGRNPAKAGLPRERWIRWIHPTWDAAGWAFRENE
jgi:putative transposase